MSSTPTSSGPVVVDTGVFGADLVPGSELSDLYEPILRGRPVVISFQTVAELRYGARRRRWGDLRLRQLEARIGQAEIIYPGPELIEAHVDLRVACAEAGHALAARIHDADRWIAATAIRLRIPLVAHDRIFVGAPELQLRTELPEVVSPHPTGNRPTTPGAVRGSLDRPDAPERTPIHTEA